MQESLSRIADLIYSTKFFVGSRDIDIDLEMAIAPLKSGYSPEEIVFSVLELLPQTGKNLNLCLVADFPDEDEDRGLE